MVTRAPLRKARRVNWWWGVILGSPLVAGGGLIGGLIGFSGLVAGAPATLALMVTVLGGTAGEAILGEPPRPPAP